MYAYIYLSILCIYSYYDTKAVFLALIITAIVCVIVTIFCFQTKVQLRM